MNAFFRKLFGRDDHRPSEPQADIDPPSSALTEKRIQAAATSLLENEALTADLDDEAAKVLLDWGVTRARQIAAQTTELDDVAAEEALDPPMRALRKMLRAINHWILAPDEAGLQNIIEQARIVYGPEYVAPDPHQRAQFLDQIGLWAGDPPELIRKLHLWIENKPFPSEG